MTESTGLTFVQKFDGGHALFEDGIGQLYIKDESGEGPQRIDHNKTIAVRNSSWMIPLVGGLVAPAPIEEAMHIAAQGGLMVETARTLWRVSEA